MFKIDFPQGGSNDTLGVGIHRNCKVKVTLSEDKRYYTIKVTNTDGIHSQSYWYPNNVQPFANESNEEANERATREFESGVANMILAYASNDSYLNSVKKTRAEFLQSFHNEDDMEGLIKVIDFINSNDVTYNVKLLGNYNNTKIELPTKNKFHTACFEIYVEDVDSKLKINKWEAENRSGVVKTATGLPF